AKLPNHHGRQRREYGDRENVRPGLSFSAPGDESLQPGDRDPEDEVEQRESRSDQREEIRAAERQQQPPRPRPREEIEDRYENDAQREQVGEEVECPESGIGHG